MTRKSSGKSSSSKIPVESDESHDGYQVVKVSGRTFKLTKQQDDFARHYALTGDVVGSYRHAGYMATGDANSDQSRAQQVRQGAAVSAGIRHYKAAAVKKVDISEKELAAEIGAIALSDITLALDDDGQVDIRKLKSDPDLLPTRRAIKSIKTKTGRNGTETTITMHDKLPALKLVLLMWLEEKQKRAEGMRMADGVSARVEINNYADFSNAS